MENRVMELRFDRWMECRWNVNKHEHSDRQCCYLCDDELKKITTVAFFFFLICVILRGDA